jgi:hypothetical protein
MQCKISLNEPGMMKHICNPITQEAEEENYEFKATLGYIVNSRSEEL